MNCSCSEEKLALFVEDDLPVEEARRVDRHVEECDWCRNACERLRRSQAFFKARLGQSCGDSISPRALTEVRHAVLSQIENPPRFLGLPVRIPRLVWFGYRRNAILFASFAAVLVISIAVLTQLRPPTEAASAVAVFDGKDMLLRPEGYREWVFVGSSLGPHVAGGVGVSTTADKSFGNVYINRSAYREYSQTGKFPEGTMLVLELVSPGQVQVSGAQQSFGKDFVGLEVSVKDSTRFDGSWGFFDFTAEKGAARAQALPESSGCRSCHRQCAETDQVFTQFYPVLKATRA